MSPAPLNMNYIEILFGIKAIKKSYRYYNIKLILKLFIVICPIALFAACQPFLMNNFRNHAAKHTSCFFLKRVLKHTQKRSLLI